VGKVFGALRDVAVLCLVDILECHIVPLIRMALMLAEWIGLAI